ncbi:unnamed protein product [Meganyctiphanes norvegica]|uniref:RING-type domain-containing protein n=1 Tax=Meganyctiphanes norvegica TaxID=48144 RepID=A0AAV2RBE2_MEGNR
MEKQIIPNNIVGTECEIVKNDMLNNINNSQDMHSQTGNDVGIKSTTELDFIKCQKYLASVTKEECNFNSKEEAQNYFSEFKTGYKVGGYDETKKFLAETKTGYNVGGYDEKDGAIGFKHIPQKMNTSINLEEDTCVFCLEPSNLIQFCDCKVMTHKKCAVSYVTYPSSMNDKCPMCRKDLDFKVVYGKTTMKTRYIFYIFLIILINLAVVALSLYATTLLIPQNEMNIYIYILIICNVGIFAPISLVFLIALALDCCAPQNRINSSASGGWCFWGGCPDCNGCCDGGGGGGGNDCVGEGCEIVILGICLLIVLCFLISGIAYMIYNIVRYSKSFSRKSADDIKFRNERKVLP